MDGITTEDILTGRIKITFFPNRGRTDTARMVLEHAGIPYEEETIYAEDWPTKRKPYFETVTCCHGKLPLFEVIDGNGKVIYQISQGRSISKYVARLARLIGSGRHPQDTVYEDSGSIFPLNPGGTIELNDMVIDTVLELHEELAGDYGLYWEPADKFEARRAKTREFYEKKLPLLERFFNQTKTNPHHWIKDSMSLGDVYTAYFLEQLPILFPGLFTSETFPSLYTFYINFFTTGKIGEYVRSERRRKIYTTMTTAAWGGPTWTGLPEQNVQWK